jgi:hypothetical protein
VLRLIVTTPATGLPRLIADTTIGSGFPLVEVRPDGRQVAVKKLDTCGSPAGAGALFGLAVAPYNAGVYFVDDAANTLDLLH